MASDKFSSKPRLGTYEEALGELLQSVLERCERDPGYCSRVVEEQARNCTAKGKEESDAKPKTGLWSHDSNIRPPDD